MHEHATNPPIAASAAAPPQELAAWSGLEDATIEPAVTKAPPTAPKAEQPTFPCKVPPGTTPGTQLQVRAGMVAGHEVAGRAAGLQHQRRRIHGAVVGARAPWWLRMGRVLS